MPTTLQTMSIQKHGLRAAVAGVLLLLAGCASQPNPEKEYKALLTYPERLTPSKHLTGGYGWVAPDANFRQYDKVLLNRILVKFDGPSKEEAIDAVTLGSLVEVFRKDIVKALEPKYQVVNQPGPGVLVVQITLFDLVPTNVTESVAMQAVPFGAGGVGEIVMGEADGTGFGSAPYLGHTGIVLELADSQSKRVIGEFADTEFGKQFVVDLHKGVGAGFKKGTDAYKDGFAKWAYAKEAFEKWSAFFRVRLDELHAS